MKRGIILQFVSPGLRQLNLISKALTRNWNKVLIKETWKWKFNDVPLSKHVITKLIKHWRTTSIRGSQTFSLKKPSICIFLFFYAHSSSWNKATRLVQGLITRNWPTKIRSQNDNVAIYLVYLMVAHQLKFLLFFSTKKLPNRNLNKRLNWKGDPSILKFVFSPMLLKWMAARFIEAFCSWSLFLRFLSYFRGIVDTRVLSN